MTSAVRSNSDRIPFIDDTRCPIEFRLLTTSAVRSNSVRLAQEREEIGFSHHRRWMSRPPLGHRASETQRVPMTRNRFETVTRFGGVSEPAFVRLQFEHTTVGQGEAEVQADRETDARNPANGEEFGKPRKALPTRRVGRSRVRHRPAESQTLLRSSSVYAKVGARLRLHPSSGDRL